uniref:NADH dehydrogenase subunit 6 n=1 Tax=Molipteryx lunata TaxID=2575659 RepID=A0A4D6X137_9HEMI|nr:NADH dehydrogenase subunit 6 [Molipteryx lunata]YP_010995006.1 NADH dehydrogenase subunit 6 [Molipteryx fuliginosa]QCI09336.1 NADH dehydrogenase subunit 6 [Molipteryx lunata]WOZ14014.1 NADH dehydrogenase subunit 6 [Molipteryx fuliginosa]
MKTLIFSMLVMAFVFPWLSHPISMGIMIILQTIITSVVIGLSMGSFWFSYIVMITVLSGILVLFIYMASTASNEKFHSSIKLLMFLTVLIAVTMYISYKYNKIINLTSIFSTEILSLNNLFNCKFKLITLIMVLYLFFVMITISSIVNISEGPLKIYKK